MTALSIPKSYDLIGTIAILKFPEETKLSEKKRIAKLLLAERKHIKTVVEKVEKVSGRLRTIKTRYLAGIKTKETVHTESGCRFKMDIDKCYFSPRLSNERLEVARMINKNDNVLVLFAGVAPFSIVIAKLAKPKRVVSVEISRIANKYAKENVKLNKLSNLEIVRGDVKRVVPKIARKEKFSVIVMPRPQLKETFFKEALFASRKSSRIIYYGFADTSEEIINQLKDEAKKLRKKIIVLRSKKAGEIAPYRYRWRIDIMVV